MKWIEAAGRAVARGLGNMARQPRASAAVVAAIAVVVVLVALSQLAARNVDALTSAWNGGAQMVVYLEPDASADRAHVLGAALAELDGVERVDYVAPEMALRRLRGSLGEHDDLVAGLEVGMLPASLEVTLDPSARDIASAHPIIDKLRRADGVEQVEIADDWVDRVAAAHGLLRSGARIAWLIACAIGAYLAWIALRFYARERRREDAVLHLMGASRAFVRGPRAIVGAILGVVGASVGIIALWALFAWVAGDVESALADAFGAGPVVFLPGSDIATLIAFGAAIGALGGALGNRVTPGRRA